MESLSDFEFRARRAPGTKQLIEELLPLATLLKYLESPGLTPRCRYQGPDKTPDAEIHFSGRRVERRQVPAEVFVEITTAVSPLDHLRREALNQDGAVYGGPGIWTVGSRNKGTRRVISEAVAQYGGTHIRNAVSTLQERITQKSAHTYRSPCILLVALQPEKAIRPTEWSQIVGGAASAVVPGRFAGVYIATWDQGIVLPVAAV